MKPILEKSEHRLLLQLIQHGDTATGPLAEELKRAQVVTAAKMSPDIVRLNSTVTVEIPAEKRVVEFTVVLPEDMDVRAKRISVLAPMAVAVIGFRAGDEIDWQLAGTRKRLRIVSVKPADLKLPMTG